MAWVTRLRLHHRGLLSGLVFTVAAATVIVLAVTAKGQPATEVKLNDGGVWVTATNISQVAQYVPQVHQQGVPIPVKGSDFDLLQVGGEVLSLNRSAQTMQAFDPTTGQPGGEAVVVGDSQVALGGPVGDAVVAVVDSSGKVWVLPFDGVEGFNPATVEPVTAAGSGADVAVGVDGTVYVTAPSRHSLITISAASHSLVETALPGEKSTSAHLTVTAVGTDPVVLDATHHQLLLRGRSVSLPSDDDGVVLQQPSAAADSVLLAAHTGLLQVQLAGGEPEQVGDPVQASTAQLTPPVRVNSCSYGVFIEASSIIQTRGGGAACKPGNVVVDPGRSVLPDTLVYRVNRGLLALNDPATGAIWDPTDDQPKPLDDWPKRRQLDTKDEPGRDNDKCDPGDDPPQANPDAVGARRGLPVVIPVLANDKDPNCDVLALAELPKVDPADAGLVGLVGDGRLVQFTPDIGFAGSVVHLSYEASDGRNRSDPAQVTITLKAGNDPPRLLVAGRHPNTVVVQGGTVSYNVLGSFLDPDGDPLQLVGASVDASQGNVSFTPDGLVTYQSSGSVGSVEVKLVVSDGRQEAVDKLLVDVKPKSASLTPTAVDDYQRTIVGVPLTFNPLANDSDPRQNQIRLANPGSPPDGLTVKQGGGGAGSITVMATKPRSYEWTYTIVAGSGSAEGKIRVDVTDSARNRPPTAMVDSAGIQPGVETRIDVLANDVDPDHDVLAVTDVQADEGSGVAASVIQQRTVVVRTSAALKAPVTLQYHVTDGQSPPVPGTVVLIPTVANLDSQSPRAQPDQIRVPAGAMTTIPVLANDIASPGHRLVLASDLAVSPTEGKAFVNGDVVRYLAGQTVGKNDSFSYKIVDSDGGESATGLVRVVVIDPGGTSQPTPPTLEARVHQGSTVEIDVPTSGADPDGSATVLTGALVSEFQNTVTTAGNVITYRADGPGLGTDQVSYQLCAVDTDHRCATGTIRVGVFPADGQNEPPVAHPFTVTMRPGSSYPIPVTAFVTDPDGDPISLVSDPDKADLASPPMKALVVPPDDIQLIAPDEPGTYRVSYQVKDDFNEPVEGTIAVTVAADAPTLAPVANDDVITPDQAIGDSVLVDVLANDTDADGSSMHPVLLGTSESTGDTSGPTVVGDRIRVPLTGLPQVIAYQALDEDGNAGTAFILVFGADAPRLKEPPSPLTVAVGETLKFDLSQVITDPDGKPETLRVVSSADVTAQPISKNAGHMVDHTTITYIPTTMPSTGNIGYISVQVTDGKNTVPIAVPVTITGGDIRPITVRSVSVDVEVGTSFTKELTSLVDDPNGVGSAPLTFAKLDSKDQGPLKVDIASDGKLTVAVTDPGAVGRSVLQGFTVRRADADPVRATLTLTVVATTKPEPEGIPVTVPRLDVGQEIQHDLIAPLDDPLAGTSNAGLTLVSVEAQSDRVDASLSGDTVMLKGMKPGPAKVKYTIQDGLGRTAAAWITVQVWGPPSRPGRPGLQSPDSLGADWVLLTWGKSQANVFSHDPNATDLHYVVSWTDAGVTQSKKCPENSCRITDLKPGTSYQFTVTAFNDVGPSDPSEVSAPIMPDELPAAPVFTPVTPATDGFGDGYVKLDWKQPAYKGSAISTYRLEVVPNSSSSDLSVPVGTTSKIVDGLTNGTEYTFILCATNALNIEVCSDPWQGTPIAVPGPVSNINVKGVDDPAGGRIDVSWTAPSNDGGDSGLTYQTVLLKDGTPVSTPPPTTDTSIQIPASVGVSYTVRVTAHNKKGDGPSRDSGPVKSLSQPGPVTNLKAQGTGVDRALQLSWDDPVNRGGAAPADLSFELSLDGTSWEPLAGKSISVTNGTAYTVRVRVRNGTSFPSDVASYALKPADYAYANPPVPSLNATVSGPKVTFNWSASAENGLTVSVTLSINGAAATPVSATGSWPSPSAYSTSYTVIIKSCLQEHISACSSTKLNKTTAAPPPKVTVSKGARYNPPGCSGSACRYVVVTVENFPPNKTFKYTMYDSHDGSDWPDLSCRQVSTNSSGNGSSQCYVYGYTGYIVTVTFAGLAQGSLKW